MYTLEITRDGITEKKTFDTFIQAAEYTKEEIFAGLISEVDVKVKLICKKD